MVFNGNSHKGTYTLKKPEKYLGDKANVKFRSSWERAAFNWCERNPKIYFWSSEEIVVPYFSTIDEKMHRYFVDLFIDMGPYGKYLVEIKPKVQVNRPLKTKGKSRKKTIEESLTYVKNQEKWNSASAFAKQRGWQFVVWTEDDLRKLGVKII